MLQITWHQDRADNRAADTGNDEPADRGPWVPDLSVLDPWAQAMAKLWQEQFYADTPVIFEGETVHQGHRAVLSRYVSEHSSAILTSDAFDVSTVSKTADEYKELLFNIYTASSHPNCVGLTDHLQSCFRSGDYADVTILSGTLEIRAHKCVLAAHSEYFHTIFNSGFSEAQDNIIELSDGDPHIVSDVINYIYTGDFIPMLQSEDIIGFLIMAHRLMIQSLVSHLLRAIEDHVTRENVCSLLALADTLEFPQLKEKCLFLAVRHLTELETSEYYEDLTPKLRGSLQILRSSLEAGIMDDHCICSAKEVVGMLKESLQERQERHDEAVRRQEVERDALSRAVSTLGATTTTTFSRRQARPGDGLAEWRGRVDKVDLALQREGRRLAALWNMYEMNKRMVEELHL